MPSEHPLCADTSVSAEGMVTRHSKGDGGHLNFPTCLPVFVSQSRTGSNDSESRLTPAPSASNPPSGEKAISYSAWHDKPATSFSFWRPEIKSHNRIVPSDASRTNCVSSGENSTRDNLMPGFFNDRILFPVMMSPMAISFILPQVSHLPFLEIAGGV